LYARHDQATGRLTYRGGESAPVRIHHMTFAACERRGWIERDPSGDYSPDDSTYIRAYRLTANGRTALGLPAEHRIVDRTSEAPACASAVRIGDRIRIADVTGTVTYVEVRRFPGDQTPVIEMQLDDVTTPDGPRTSWWGEMPTDQRLAIIFARPLRRTAVAA
jgi:hypothetical protein